MHLSAPALRTIRAGQRFIAVMRRDLDRLTSNAAVAAKAGYNVRFDAELIAAGETVIAIVREMLRGIVREERRLFALERAEFNPDQPRVPAGNPGGGEWTSGDWGGGTPRATPISDRIRKPINLLDEQAKGGHGYSKHVGKSEAELIKTLDDNYYRFFGVTVDQAAEGSFADLLQANDFVNRTLDANEGIVDLVSEGQITREAWIARRFGYQTGYEAYRQDADSDPYIRPTYNVGIFIVHDSSTANGFRVITAYPFNDRPDE
jgi:hypothetical protein